MDRVVTDLARLFSVGAGESEADYDATDGPGALYDPEGNLGGGKNYAGDDA